MSRIGKVEISRSPIEWMFPIEQLNRLAERESHAKMYYRPPLTIHKWWARRLGSVFRTILMYTFLDEDNLDTSFKDIREYFGMKGLLGSNGLWQFYTKNVKVNATVLDPMMGGGTTILEALKLGCNVIGVELNPVAWFVVKKMIGPVDLKELDRAFQSLEENIAPEIKKYYKTLCPSGHEADVMYYFWVKELECLNCGNNVSLFKDFRIANPRTKRDFCHIICPECHLVFQIDYKQTCPECDEEFNVEGGKVGYICKQCGKNFKVFELEQTCKKCDNKFNPSKGNVSKNGRAYICKCGQNFEIIEAIKQLGKPNEQLYATEYYCAECDEKGYKSIDDFDLKLYEKAAKEYEKIENVLPIPHQEIPEGKETTPRLPNHGYRYFKDMFNKRQLLNLGKNMKNIMEIKETNIRELMLLAFSESLNFNNTFCEYNRYYNKTQEIWKRHAFHPKLLFIENNVWGTKYGSGCFKNQFRKLRKGKEYLENPYEKYIQNDKTKEKQLSNKIQGKLVNSFKELGEIGNSILLCRSADYIPLDGNVDAVITDPPYYDNVMYSELSDFYYVWLREALKEEYDCFRSEYTPKIEEVVVNSTRDRELTKEERKEKYIRGLTNIFTESNRLLKDDGLLIFTFHHKDSEAWSSVLQSVLDAGFYIVATYPIHSEMATSTHIYEKQNISYDTIVVCRKKLGKKKQAEMPWKIIEDQVYSRSKEMAKQYIQMNGSRLSLPDMSVVVRGKGLEIFSQHYPNIVKEDGTIMGIYDALEKVTDIVDEHLINERISEISSKADKITAIYLLLLAERKDISYDALHRQLQGRGLEPDDFTMRKLLERRGDRLYRLAPEDRASFIKEMSPSERNALDKAHYLYFLRKSRKYSLVDNIQEWAENNELKQWIDDSVTYILKELASETRDKDYESLARYVEQYIGKDFQRDLHQFIEGEQN